VGFQRLAKASKPKDLKSPFQTFCSRRAVRAAAISPVELRGTT
jgi:hypothetical protein